MAPFQHIGKFLIILGALLVLCGIILYFAPKFPLLEKIPGNFRWQKGPVTVYFPLGLSIALSIILTILLRFWGKW